MSAASKECKTPKKVTLSRTQIQIWGLVILFNETKVQGSNPIVIKSSLSSGSQNIVGWGVLSANESVKKNSLTDNWSENVKLIIIYIFIYLDSCEF